MKNESKILKLSVFTTLFFAVLGVSWGWLISSKMIFFDGLYSFVSVALSSASLYVCKIINERDNRDFYYGKFILEPLIISINSTILIIMCAYSFLNAISTIINGGNGVKTTSGLIYATLSTTVCFLFYKRIAKYSKSLSSELVKSESIQWFTDFTLSAAVLAGFIFIFIIEKTSYSYISNYIDSLMVAFASAYCMRNPIKIFKSNFSEVLGNRVPKNIYKDVCILSNEIKKEYNFAHTIAKVMKIGRSIKVEVNFINDENINDISIIDFNNIKSKLYNNINTGNYIKDLEITFIIGKDICIEITS